VFRAGLIRGVVMSDNKLKIALILALTAALIGPVAVQARDLPEVITSGVLRHIGIPYANFVTGSGDGLDVEIMQGFAADLGVRYEFVESDWHTMFGDLTGHNARLGDQGTELTSEAPIRGDVIANGVTILPWRKDIVTFSDPTFPSGVWLLARAESAVQPIVPSDSETHDIALVKASMSGLTVLAQKNTCLDPALYRLSDTQAEVRLAEPRMRPDEFAPAILGNMAETTLLDVPNALIALERWAGRIKVIGPVSGDQSMAAAFRKNSPRLREAFNRYLSEIRQDGSYPQMVKKYFPSVFLYYAGFFEP